MARPRCLLAAICLLACASASVATISPAQDGWSDVREGKVPIPDRIGDLWISADLLVTRNGGLLLAQHKWIDQAWGEQLLAAYENPSEDCLNLGPNGFMVPLLPDSLAEAVASAGVIIYGVVTGIAGGFYAGAHPGLLIQVEVREWVKQGPEDPENPYVYFYCPNGNFTIGSIKICKKDPYRPDPPEVGDEVLLLPDIRPLGPEKIVVRIDKDVTRVVTGNQTGIQFAPAVADTSEFRTATSIEELKRLMEKVLREK